MYLFFPELIFSFNQVDYEAVESELEIELFIDKFQALANPVTVSITPLTVMNAMQSNMDNDTPIPLNLDVPPNADNDPIFNPNRAKGNVTNYVIATVLCKFTYSFEYSLSTNVIFMMSG